MTDFYEKLVDAVGREVIASSVGHGSFIDIEFSGGCAATGRLQLWVYMAEWALLEDDAEIVASDMSDGDFASKKPLLANLVGTMTTQVVTFEGKGEFHIDFSGHYRLEIWAAPTVYGRDAPIARLYSDGRHISDLVLSGDPESSPGRGVHPVCVENLTEQLSPPWIRFPESAAESIGWRMGPGEEYYDRFYQWFSSLDNTARASFRNANPEPRGWKGFYERIEKHPWKL